MAPKTTKRPFDASGPVQSTERPSPGSKSSYQRGLDCEKHVAQYFLSRGYKIIGQRFKTPFSEIDLVVQNSNELILVEVKSLSSIEWLEFRVPAKQASRLRRGLVYFQSQSIKTVRLHLATVTKGGEVTVYPDFLS